MATVTQLQSYRERRLDELTRRAMQLPRYRRLALMVALCERLRDSRRLTRRSASVIRHPHTS